MHTITHTLVDTLRMPRPQKRGVDLLATLFLWRRRFGTRRHLRALDRRDLDDVGINSTARRREAAKWFWQP